jgi:hypothetical protein
MAIRKFKEKPISEADKTLATDTSRFDFQKKLTQEFEAIKLLAKEDDISLVATYTAFPFDFILKLNDNNSVFPHLFLLDNGNIRALWRVERDQIGLQFLSDKKTIQYVMMKQRGEDLNTAYGRVQNEHILRLVASMELESLIYAKG